MNTVFFDLKKLLMLVLILSICRVQAQNKFKPESEGFGKASGTSVSQQIGPAGGKITSGDGRVELVFPVGALNNKTTISIQPVTNLFDSAAGKAYQFEPSGIE